MPTVITRGAASAEAFGAFAQAKAVNYIENVFSTYLYTGTGATQSINNGINLSANGGLVWIKDRTNAYNHNLFDTTRGSTKLIQSNTTAATATDAVSLTSFNTNGFSLGTGNTSGSQVNTSTDNFVSWAFQKQAKFFDIVTYTGTGASQTIPHNLGSTPGFMVVKATSTTSPWTTWHTSTGNARMYLNLTNASVADNGTIWGDGSSYIAPTSTNFTISGNTNCGANGVTYVIYLFASNAGGFGSDGTQNVITCGSFTTDSSGNASVTLGYEPQWLLVKLTNTTGNWQIVDNMRAFPAPNGQTAGLYPNLSIAELAGAGTINVTSTGFTANSVFGVSNTIAYIAIRRGPMATPTSGTSVFLPSVQSNDSSPVTTGFPVDMFMNFYTVSSGQDKPIVDRLRGSSVNLYTNTTGAEASNAGTPSLASNTTYTPYLFGSATVAYAFRRAPGFFDEVCYTGTGSATTQAHNLGVVPELMIIKGRTTSGPYWAVYAAPIFPTSTLNLNDSGVSSGASLYFNSTAPTSTVFSLGTGAQTNTSADSYVAYLFATLVGVSKVGSFTGTGGTQTINCGFGASGARWVIIKRTDSTGNWYIFNSASGFTSSSSPYELINTTGVPVTGNNGCYAASTGFTLTSNASATVNVNGASYIFLAIA